MNVQSFDSLGEKYIPEIDAAVSSYFITKNVQEKYEFINKSLDILRDYCLRPGKRIRPLLVIAAYEGYSGMDASGSGVISVAAASELCHASFLVHDDIIDKAMLRRGLPSMNSLLDEELMTSMQKKSAGSDVGIVFGDILLFNAVELVAGADVDPSVRCSLMKEMTTVYQKTAWGQALDIIYTKPAQIVSSDYAPGAISELKTAYYTIAGPLLWGLRLSGKFCDAESQKIMDFALPLGTAFQLRDDLIGVYGNEKDIGKSSDSDLVEGKYTLLVQKAGSLLSAENKNRFERIFSSDLVSQASVSLLRNMITDCGARKWAEDEVARLVSVSKSCISNLSLDNKGTAVLNDLCALIQSIPIATS